MPYCIRIIETGVDAIVNVHHHGDKPSARRFARRAAELTWPAEDGYRHKWSGDAVVVMRDGRHVGDCAVEPLKEMT